MYTLNALLSDGLTCCLNMEYQMYVIVPCLNAFALSGRVNIICCGITQGVASLALGYVLVGLSARALSVASQQFKQA